MKCYRVKHVETGLYYRPCVGVGKRKTNLGTRGKVYTIYPKKCPVFENRYLVNVSETQIKKFKNIKLFEPDWYSGSENQILSNEQTWEIEEI